MMKNVKVWKCDACTGIICFKASPVISEFNESCVVYNDELGQMNWKETDEFEITKKIPDITDALDKDELNESLREAGFNLRSKMGFAQAVKTVFSSMKEGIKSAIDNYSEYEKFEKKLVEAFGSYEKCLAFVSGEDQSPNPERFEFDTSGPTYEKSPAEMEEMKKTLSRLGIPPKQTPNCAICRWTVETTISIDNLECIAYVCSGQGYNDCDSENVYNSTECKALFEPTEPLQVFKSGDEAKQFIKDRVEPDQDEKVLTAEEFMEQRTSGTLWNLCKVSFDTFRGLLIEFFNAGKYQGRLERDLELRKGLSSITDISIKLCEMYGLDHWAVIELTEILRNLKPLNKND